MRSLNYNKILLAFLVVLLFLLTTLFISLYCNFFDDLNLLAKNRLVDYPLLTFIVTPLFFWLAAFLCYRFAPYASGQHLQTAINQLKETPNNFEKIAPYMSFRTIIVKAVSSLLSSFAGGSLGKEGPSVHMSAGIFASFANRYKNFLEKIELEAWFFSGCSIGLTIAFNAPIAGVVFAAEKLSKLGLEKFRKNIFWVFISTGIVAVMFHQSKPFFVFHQVGFTPGFPLLKLLIITILLCGIFGMVTKFLGFFFLEKTMAVKSKYWHLIPISAGIVVAFINFYCGIYSFGGGVWTIQEILTNEEVIISYKEVLGRICNTIITFGSGSAGGLIAPAVTIGTSIGSLIGTILVSEMGICLLLAMAGFLGSMLGEPIAAAIIVLEITGQNIEILPILLIASTCSLLLSKKLQKSLSGIEG